MVIEIIGLVFSMIIGTLGHFLYEWSYYNKFIGFWFSKGKSLWEHMKLGITPIILWTIFEFFTFNFTNLFFAKFLSIITFSVCLIVLYYGYKLITKKNILFLDILIFYISLWFSTIVSTDIMVKNLSTFLNLIGLMGIIFIIFLYFKFDKNTPNWFIFKD